MTNKQINWAIAEACEWKWHDHPDCMAKKEGWTMPEKWIMHPDGTLKFRHDIPNYCNDLNAMHEAEKVLIAGFEDEPESSEPWSDYQTNLIITCKAYLSYHATARQRAEAFLRTLGKWEEAK